ncbi:MAG: nucleotidyltransferase family protein [Gammaproteobacteria bacterium AqS3]|nr:nucleotidyltransferase family protein [Gammaproteobacteria bacterium AqS3]
MLLAAGFGSRLRPLTDTVPKALVEVQGRPLLHHQLSCLAGAGAQRTVINLGHLGHRIEQWIEAEGAPAGLEIVFSREPPEAPLETGGGLRTALELLGGDPFWVLNCDIWARFDWPQLRPLEGGELGRLWVVDAVVHAGSSEEADFSLDAEGRLHPPGAPGCRSVIYAGAGLVHPELVRLVEAPRYSLTECLHLAVQAGKLKAHVHDRAWIDIGSIRGLERAQNLKL